MHTHITPSSATSRLCLTWTYRAEAEDLGDEDGGDDGHLVEHAHGATQTHRRYLRDIQGDDHCVETCNMGGKEGDN